MMRKYRINIKSKTDSLTLSHYSVCRVLDGGLSGFDSPSTAVRAMGNAFADGGYLTGRRFEARVLGIYFEVTDREKYPAVRDSIMRLMDPREDVKITAYIYGRRRVITATPSGKPEFILDNFGDFPRVRLSFICEDPFFTEERELRVSLPTRIPLFTFPLNLMGEAGTAVSFNEGTMYHRIYNPGDAECGFVATVFAAHGDVVQPFVELNGERLQYMGTLKLGDTAVFDTRAGSKCLTVNGTINYNFGRTNRFFGLEKGENKLHVSASDKVTNLMCDLYFKPLYLGV